VVCLHLKAKPPNSAKRADQIAFILSTLKDHLGNIRDIQNHPVLICGDFNGEQTERFFDLIKNDRQFSFKNSYAESVDANGRQLPSTFKIREQIGLVSHTIDFIFFTDSSLALVKLLNMLDESEIDQEIGLPNLTFPSDHISLVCDFKIFG
jgi:mRNA deadenylase 3'-5' endonuclease subunit Ccr4